MPPSSGRNGYRVEPDELAARLATLTSLGESTAALVASAGRLAERRPMLGTAPPAVHMAERLREAAGRSGLTGAVEAADRELTSFQEALAATIAKYEAGESDVEWTLRTTGKAGQ
ncbi:hypothetical protein [Saccharothrix deserti]|uniref:hypothetical protein n=1 Tax=Saccharothrix deserti TaxID=2593674 RepID=UPI00131C853F|nr:hypothetical protein [Saccharothrix deserti]